MRTYFTLILVFVTYTFFSQNEHKHVKLAKQKQGKRVVLYATNTDSISYDIFLKVDTKDFRRSSNRPIIKNIPANSKIKLITLIQLANTKGIYNTTFIVNEVAYAMNIQKDHEALEFKIDRAIKDRKLIIFTKDRCNICKASIDILKKNNIDYTEYNIDVDSTNYLKIVKELKTKESGTKSQIPMLKVDNQVYNKIKTIEDFSNALRQAFN